MSAPVRPMRPIDYRLAEVYLFDTCSMRCGYCWLAETGKVADAGQLAIFREPGQIDRITGFFNSRTTPDRRWILQLSGGEPLLMPNLDRFCENLFRLGNKVAYYTSLFVNEDQRGFQFLLNSSPVDVDYVMASFHPEAEGDERGWMRKLELLKEAGHSVFLRFVGQPSRLHRLDDLARKCRELDICFYPTTLLSNTYPGAYSSEEKAHLAAHFASVSQLVQLEGGVDTATVQCAAGGKLIAVNLQTGNITPCISVNAPSLGNLYDDSLSLHDGLMACPEPGISCLCDIHYQQDVVAGVSDSKAFVQMKRGYVAPQNFASQLEDLRSIGIRFYPNRQVGIGAVRDDLRLFYTVEEVRNSLRKSAKRPAGRRHFRAGQEIPSLISLQDAAPANSATVMQKSPLRVVTPAEQWSYAVVFRLPEERLRNEERLILSLEFGVEKGKVGIGLVAEDFRTFVGEGEAVAIRGDASLTINLEAADKAAWLVIRNVAVNSEPSVVTLMSLRTFSVDPHQAGSPIPESSTSGVRF